MNPGRNQDKTMNTPKQITITASADALYEMMELIMTIAHRAAGPDAEPPPMFCLASAIQAQIEAACPELIGTKFSDEYTRYDADITTMLGNVRNQKTTPTF